ncbi:MAG: hypothetical protein ACI8Z5_002309 [Lentimonas sp.]|jgi:hypothetical protein
MYTINPCLDLHSDEHEHLKGGAVLLMTLGSLHLLLSVTSMLVIVISPTITLLGEASLFAFLNVTEFISVHAFISGYFALQVCLGWVVGLFTIRAGRDCQHTHAWHFVFRMILLNWLMVPVGTIMGWLIWRDLRRKGIRDAFDDV